MQLKLISIIFFILLASSVSGNVFLKGGDGFTGVNPPYLYNIGLTIFFNETELNATIDARDDVGAGGIDYVWTLDDWYLHNVSDVLTFNESRLNDTIDTRSGGVVTDYKWTLDDVFLHNISETLRFNETRINQTIDNRTYPDTNESNRFDNLPITCSADDFISQIATDGTTSCTTPAYTIDTDTNDTTAIIELNGTITTLLDSLQYINLSVINLNESVVHQIGRIDYINQTQINDNITQSNQIDNLNTSMNSRLENGTNITVADFFINSQQFNTVAQKAVRSDTIYQPYVCTGDGSTPKIKCETAMAQYDVFRDIYDPDNTNFARADSGTDTLGFMEDNYITIDVRNTGGQRGEYVNISINSTYLNDSTLNLINGSPLNVSDFIVQGDVKVDGWINATGDILSDGDINASGACIPEYMSLVTQNAFSCTLYCSAVAFGGHTWTCLYAFTFTGVSAGCSSTSGYRNCVCHIVKPR